MGSNKYIVFGSPQITESDVRAVESVLRSKWIGTGPKVERFEKEFRDYMKSPLAVAVDSCTAGLFLSMQALGIGPVDEVITSDMTFCATVNAILHVGATPVLVDCDRQTMNITAEEIKRHITPRTRAIIPVHFAGRPCPMQEIMQLAEDYNLIVVEDCAHAIEATIDSRHCGTFGKMGCFSFYVTKNLTSGEGGMVITRNPEMAKLIKVLTNHGISKDAWKRFHDGGYCHYEVIHPGYKFNMTDVQAALGIEQLKRLEENWKRRAQLWTMFKEMLSDLPVTLPAEPGTNTRHAYHLFPILLNLKHLTLTRDEFMALLHQKGIGTGVHYRALHKHYFYKKKLGLSSSNFPNASYISERTVSLPFSAALTDSEVDYLLSTVRNVLAMYIK